MDFDLLKPFCVKEMYKPQLLHVLQYIMFKAFNLHAGFSNVAETGVNQCNFQCMVKVFVSGHFAKLIIVIIIIDNELKENASYFLVH